MAYRLNTELLRKEGVRIGVAFWLIVALIAVCIYPRTGPWHRWVLTAESDVLSAGIVVGVAVIFTGFIVCLFVSNLLREKAIDDAAAEIVTAEMRVERAQLEATRVKGLLSGNQP